MRVALLARGGHAFSMGYRTPLVTLKHWPDRMAEWLTRNDWLKLVGAPKDAPSK